MRLTSKLILALGLSVCVVLGVNAWLRVRFDRKAYEDDIGRDHRVLVRALVAAIGMLSTEESALEASALVETVNAQYDHVDIRWIRGDQEREPPQGVQRKARGAPDPATGAYSAVEQTAEGERYIVTSAPILTHGIPLGHVVVQESLQPEDEFSATTVLRSIVATGVLMLVCFALMIALGTWLVGRPLRDLAAQARRIGAGDLTRRIDVRSGDEIAALAREMNAMTDRLIEARESAARATEARIEALDQLRHGERLRTIGELSSGIAHELGTPLNVVRARGQMVASGEAPASRVRELGAIIVAEADRMARIMRDVLDYARRSPARKESIPLGRLAQSAIALVLPLAERGGVALGLAGSQRDEPVVEVDPSQLQQVLTNLLVNALQATPRGGQVTVSFGRVASTGAHDAPLGPDALRAFVSVQDTGAGISAEHLPRIFDPFFTTKAPGDGTGLGLSLARGIVQEHGGSLDVRPGLTGGSRFTVELPFADRRERRT